MNLPIAPFDPSNKAKQTNKQTNKQKTKKTHTGRQRAESCAVRSGIVLNSSNKGTNNGNTGTGDDHKGTNNAGDEIKSGAINVRRGRRLADQLAIARHEADLHSITSVLAHTSVHAEANCAELSARDCVSECRCKSTLQHVRAAVWHSKRI